MTWVKALLVVGGLAGLFATGISCGNGQEGTRKPELATGPQLGQISPVVSSPATGQLPSSGEIMGGVRRGVSGADTSIGSLSLPQDGNTEMGMRVTGEGSISVNPDLALINLGVETTERSVAEALSEASTAMDNMVKSLQNSGLENRDIQTRFFNISPQYDYQEVVELGRRANRRVLVGYTVSNSATIKIRNLDDVGGIIDNVVNAGGDSARIDGITYTVEDPQPFMAKLREAAVKDAYAKADQLAFLTGVSLGRLIFISELGGTPMPQAFGEGGGTLRAFAAPATPISSGELELRLTVQAVFDFL